MEKDLSDFETEILREAVGLADCRPWGAAVGQALEILAGNGYFRDGKLTPKGRQALDGAGSR